MSCYLLYQAICETLRQDNKSGQSESRMSSLEQMRATQNNLSTRKLYVQSQTESPREMESQKRGVLTQLAVGIRKSQISLPKAQFDKQDDNSAQNFSVTPHTLRMKKIFFSLTWKVCPFTINILDTRYSFSLLSYNPYKELP